MKRLEYILIVLTVRNRDGSYRTQENRRGILKLLARQLNERAPEWGKLSPHQLKDRHINYLTSRWKQEKLSIGTIKNRMSALRWALEKVDRSHIIKKDNDAYGLGRRQYVSKTSKAITLDESKLLKITDDNIKYSLRLQSQFGLRKEESIKFDVSQADQVNTIKLKGSWTKGGRPRQIHITTDSQRQLLNEIRDHCKKTGQTALIPPGKNYIQQANSYDGKCNRAGLHNNHGLRHNYAQQRYFDLTGRKCPHQGGKSRNQMPPNERITDGHVRLYISREMGHNRINILAIYIGS